MALTSAKTKFVAETKDFMQRFSTLQNQALEVYNHYSSLGGNELYGDTENLELNGSPSGITGAEFKTAVYSLQANHAHFVTGHDVNLRKITG